MDETTPLVPDVRRRQQQLPPPPPAQHGPADELRHVSFASSDDGDNLHHSGNATADSPASSPTPHRRQRSMSEVLTEVLTEGIAEVTEVLEEQVLPVRPREGGDHDKKLSALALSILVFYKVSGGPFGCEPTVRAAGPMYALLGFSLFPLVWCIQEVLVTAELGSAYPEPSGCTFYCCRCCCRISLSMYHKY
jgi:hypothetical protein